jgi:hypothetical protein
MAIDTATAKCPKCGEPLSFQMTTQLMSDSRMSFVIHPNKGELLSARTVGDSISSMEKLLVAVGKDLGVKTNVMVEGLEWTDGSVKIDMIIARHEPGIKKRSSRLPSDQRGTE